jgi:cytochrome c peroxidase
VRRDYDAEGNYLGTISHVLRVYLIDPQRRIRNLYSTSFLHADTLLADVETLLGETRSARGAVPAATRATEREAAATTGTPAVVAASVPATLGLPPPAGAGAPATPRQVELGRKLFFDRRLSANETFSCAMCHVPSQGFTSNEMATAVGIEGRTVKRNAPTLLNVAYAPALFHDGRAATLEEQAWGPLLAHNEMGNESDAAVVAKIRTSRDYDGMFERAYGGPPSRDRIGAALASYERTLIAAASPFDRWRFGGDEGALSAEAQRGFDLFTNTAGCAHCHTVGAHDALFTDYGFHDTGIARRSARLAERRTLEYEIAPGVVIAAERAAIADAAETPPVDEGRFEATGDPTDRHKFRTPTLRNVALTAPYMHDGSLATLDAVVRYYDSGGEAHTGVDGRIHPLDLSERDVAALVAFLDSLTGDTSIVLRDAAASVTRAAEN